MVKLATVLKPNRSWLQFRIRSIFVPTTLAAVVFAWPNIYRIYAVWRLQSFADVDLKDSEPNRQATSGWIATLIGSEDTPSPFFDPQTWFVHRSQVTGMPRYLYIVQMEPTMSIPGSSYCHFHAIDRWGRKRWSKQFNVGYCRQSNMNDSACNGCRNAKRMRSSRTKSAQRKLEREASGCNPDARSS